MSLSASKLVDGLARELRTLRRQAKSGNRHAQLELDLVLRVLTRLKTARLDDKQAQLAIEVIQAVSDPSVFLYPSDVGRIIKKRQRKKLPLQVRRALVLYEKMKEISLLTQPVGSAVGPACRISLVDFERLSPRELMHIRGQAGMLLLRPDSLSHKKAIAILSPKERETYNRIKDRFGGRKRPTLKSVAVFLLDYNSETATAERGARNHLRALKDYQSRQNEEGLPAPFSRQWYIVRAVDYFGKNPSTMAEGLVHALKSINMRGIAETLQTTWGEGGKI